MQQINYSWNTCVLKCGFHQFIFCTDYIVLEVCWSAAMPAVKGREAHYLKTILF